jgi:hypothetical protein
MIIDQFGDLTFTYYRQDRCTIEGFGETIEFIGKQAAHVIVTIEKALRETFNADAIVKSFFVQSVNPFTAF